MAAFAFAILRELGHHTAEQAAELERLAAADVCMLPLAHQLPAAEGTPDSSDYVVTDDGRGIADGCGRVVDTGKLLNCSHLMMLDLPVELGPYTRISGTWLRLSSCCKCLICCSRSCHCKQLFGCPAAGPVAGPVAAISCRSAKARLGYCTRPKHNRRYKMLCCVDSVP